MIDWNNINLAEEENNVVPMLKEVIKEQDDIFSLEIAKSKIESDSIKDLLAKAQKFIVDTDFECMEALEMSMQARKLGNQIEKTRKQIVRPHLDFNKAVKAFADDFRDQLKEIENNLTGKIEKYQHKRELRMKEYDIDVDYSISSDSGVQYEKEKISIEVIDKSKIPLEYLVFDEKKAKEDIKLGIRNIEGVEINIKMKKSYKIKSEKWAK